jgi:thiol:disulfide interchange protein DsbD
MRYRQMWFNIIFFCFLVVSPLHFLHFEIMLLIRANKVIAKLTGGIIGFYFMALALSIVSFSCTRLVGTLLSGQLQRIAQSGCSVFISISLTIYAFHA